MINKLNLIETGASAEIKKDGFSLDLQGIENWLKKKNVLKDTEHLITYNDIDKWHRSGGETYATTFEISYKSENKVLNKKLIIKAIVSIPPEKHLIDWAQKRKILYSNGIIVSNWHWHGSGIIIEDFYPYTVEYINDFTQLIHTALTLDKLGFYAIDFLKDMRCSESGKAYYIDFGFDLGEFSYFAKTISIQKLKEMYPEKMLDIENYVKLKNNP